MRHLDTSLYEMKIISDRSLMGIFGFFYRKPQIKLYAVILLGLALAVGGIVKFYSSKASPVTSAKDSENTVASVRIQEVGKKDLRKVFQLFSPLLPWKEAFVKPLAVGFVEEMPVQVGEMVKKDQVLFRMDSESQRLRSELEQIDFQVKQLDFKISMTLAKKNFISKQEANQKNLENRSTMIRARLSHLENRGISRAPFDGLVSEIGFKVGDYLDNASNVTLRVVDLSKMKVSFWVPQTVASQISKASEVRIQIGEKIGTAKIIAISPTVDQKTGSVFVEAVIPDRPMDWKAGQFVQVLLSLERTMGAIAIPRAAVQQEAGHSFVWKIDRQEAKAGESGRGMASAEDTTRVHRVEVKLGLMEDELVEVKSGLEEFDQVVVQGLAGLSEGTQVEISYDR